LIRRAGSAEPSRRFRSVRRRTFARTFSSRAPTRIASYVAAVAPSIETATREIPHLTSVSTRSSFQSVAFVMTSVKGMPQRDATSSRRSKSRVM